MHKTHLKVGHFHPAELVNHVIDETMLKLEALVPHHSNHHHHLHYHPKHATPAPKVRHNILVTGPPHAGKSLLLQGISTENAEDHVVCPGLTVGTVVQGETRTVIWSDKRENEEFGIVWRYYKPEYLVFVMDEIMDNALVERYLKEYVRMEGVLEVPFLVIVNGVGEQEEGEDKLKQVDMLVRSNGFEEGKWRVMRCDIAKGNGTFEAFQWLKEQEVTPRRKVAESFSIFGCDYEKVWRE